MSSNGSEKLLLPFRRQPPGRAGIVESSRTLNNLSVEMADQVLDLPDKFTTLGEGTSPTSSPMLRKLMNEKLLLKYPTTTSNNNLMRASRLTSKVSSMSLIQFRAYNTMDLAEPSVSDESSNYQQSTILISEEKPQSNGNGRFEPSPKKLMIGLSRPEQRINLVNADQMQ